MNTTQHNSLEIMGEKITGFQEALNIAKVFASTDLVPKDYRGKEANIVVAWQKGMELGLKPLQSLSTIAVVNGRATIWGDGLIALVKNSSKEEWTHEILEGSGDNMVAICETKRASQEQTIKRSFSVEDAKRAALWGNNTWVKYPKRMLQMRARGLCLRDAYPDVLNGLEIAEEINDLYYQQKTEAQEAPMTLAQLGLKTIKKDGFLIVEGNTYKKNDFLKQLGFEYYNNSWCKELPIGEEIKEIPYDKDLEKEEIPHNEDIEKSNPLAQYGLSIVEKTANGKIYQVVEGETSGLEDVLTGLGFAKGSKGKWGKEKGLF